MTLLTLAALVAAADPKMPPADAPDWKPVGTAGLKVWDVRPGTGPAIADRDTVRIHATGWTAADGKVFFSTRKQNASQTLTLDRLVKGAQIGLVGAKPGGVRRLWIPAALGYDRPKPGIPAGSALVFEVELLGDPLTLPDLNATEWKPGPEGLKVWDVAVGGGAAVQPGDTVTCHYTGWFPDGKKFDSSVERGQPAEFSLSGVVRGWTVGIPGMKEGGIRRLVIPYQLGYGAEGKPPTIPPRSTLVFEIEVRNTRR